MIKFSVILNYLYHENSFGQHCLLHAAKFLEVQFFNLSLFEILGSTRVFPLLGHLVDSNDLTQISRAASCLILFEQFFYQCYVFLLMFKCLKLWLLQNLVCRKCGKVFV